MSSRSHIVERLNVEKTNDGRAGMTIFGGVFIAAYCHVILLIMSGIFMVAGSLLTAISYRPQSFGEDLHEFIIRQVNSGLQVFIYCSFLILVSRNYHNYVVTTYFRSGVHKAKFWAQ